MATVVDVLETRLNLAGLQSYTAGMSKAATAHQKFSMMANAAGVASAVGLAVLGNATKEYLADAESFGRASNNFKGSFSVKEIEEFSSGLSRMSRFSDDAIADALGVAGAMGMTADAAKRLSPAAANAAESLRAKGVGIQDALGAGAKAIGTGQMRGLKQMGVFLDENAFKAASTEQRTQMLIDAYNRLGGADAALKGTKTLSGALDQMNNALKDAQAEFGKIGSGPVLSAVEQVTRLANAFNDAPEPIKATAAALTVGLVAASAAVAVAMKVMEYRAYSAMIQFGKTGAAAVGMNTAIATSSTAAAAGQVAGLGGRLGKGFGAAAGLGLGAVGVSMIPTGGNDIADAAKKHAERALSGASVGAIIGSIFPGIGTVIGGIAGAAIGIGGGMAVDALGPKAPATPATDPQLAELQKQTKLLEGMQSGKAIDFAGLSVVQQRGIMAAARSIA